MAHLFGLVIAVVLHVTYGAEYLGEPAIHRNQVDLLPNQLILPNIHDYSGYNGHVIRFEIYVKDANIPVGLGVFRKTGGNYFLVGGYEITPNAPGYHNIFFPDPVGQIPIQKYDVLGLWFATGNVEYSAMGVCGTNEPLMVLENYPVFDESTPLTLTELTTNSPCRVYSLNATIVPCSRGYKSVVGPAHACVKCPAGTYQPLPSQKDCRPCPAGHTSEPASYLVSHCQPPTPCTPVSIGDEVMERNQWDTIDKMAIIWDIFDGSPYKGTVIEFHLYSKHDARTITLALFRKVGVSGNNYQVVGTYQHTTTMGVNDIILAPGDQIDVEKDDVLGFFFLNSQGTIWYSTQQTDLCERPLSRSTSALLATPTIGQTLSLPVHNIPSDPNNMFPCRIYSLEAIIIPTP